MKFLLIGIGKKFYFYKAFAIGILADLNWGNSIQVILTLPLLF